MRKYASLGVFATLSVLLVSGIIWAQGAKRRPPPKGFDKSVEEAFFKDVANEHGAGKFSDVFATSGRKGSAGNGPDVTPDQPGGAGNANSGWSKIISAETLENEIKAAINASAQHVESKTKWNTGHRKIRMLYSSMAMCFGVIGEYDGTVKFQKEAGGFRDALAKSAANSKVNDERALIEAKKLLTELVEVRNGGSSTLKPSEEKGKPYGVSEVAEIMKRMQIAHAPEGEDTKGIQRWTSDASRFKVAKSDLLHEAEMMAMLAKVLQDKVTFDLANNADFAKFAADIQTASQTIAAAAKSDNYESARTATGVIDKACAGCHSAYR